MEEFACKSGGGSVVVRIVENGLDILCVGGRVFEEDTFLVLSEKVAVERIRKSSEQLVRDTEQWISEAALPGTVLVRGRDPFRLMAIVTILMRRLRGEKSGWLRRLTVYSSMRRCSISRLFLSLSWEECMVR